MSLKTILFAGIAAATLSSSVLLTSAHAADNTYMCNDQRCFDDQNEETRRLNILQAEHPGAGLHAVPGYHGAAFDDRDDDDRAYDNDRDDQDGDRDYDSDDDRMGARHDRSDYDNRMLPYDDQPDADGDSDDKH